METHNLIGGRFVDAGSGQRLSVLDPATDERIAEVPDCGAAEATAVVDAAAEALPAWRARPVDERAAIVGRLGAAMLEHADELATLLTREQGKPLAEARGEIAYAASFLSWAAAEAPRLHGELVPAPSGGKRIMVLRQPVGVTAAITPWNFPAAMITRKLGPALAVGCTMVVKPAEQTPLSALAIARLAHEVGVPPGVLGVITGDAVSIAEAWMQHPALRKLSFTGSTAVGKALIRQSAQRVTRLSLELGGHAPFIVFDDADLDAAVTGAMASKFRNMGQTCICPNRFFVQAGVYEAFAAKLQAALVDTRLGHGLDDGVTAGPLIDDDAVAKVQQHVDNAREQGGRVRMGGKVVQPRPELRPRFFAPTIVEGLSGSMQMSREETFGPVVGLRRFADEAQALREANDTDYGLAAYCYTRDASRIWRMAEGLDYGIVGINDAAVSTARAPFGGMKQSGWGREGGRWVMEAYTEIKYVSWGL